MKKWSLEEKIKIVKEYKNGESISQLNKMYGIGGKDTVRRWNKKYDEGRLNTDNRGKKKSQQEIADIDILKKSYALLLKIRSQQHK